MRTKPNPPDPVVRHFESRRYFVQSKPGGREHLVDLDENNAGGECGCEDFQYRCAPLIAAGTATGLAVQCKHITAARQFELDVAHDAAIASELANPETALIR
jgi:hypothetical protein